MFRADGGDLCRSRQSVSAGHRRARARRPACHHHAGRELSRLSRRNSGAGADRQHADAGRALRSRIHARSRGQRRSQPQSRGWQQEAAGGESGTRDAADPDAHHRQWRLGAMAGAAERAGAHRPWRFVVRYLRWIFLLRQGDRGHRRRRLGDGGSAVPHALRLEGHAHSPAQRIPRLQDHAGSRAQEREDRVPDRHRGRRCAGCRARKK